MQWGFSVAAWAVGWLPWIGISGPQIKFFYNLFEPMVQSALFNTLDWITGSISFGQGLANFWAATTSSINAFIRTEINWFLLPPAVPAVLAPSAQPGWLVRQSTHTGGTTPNRISNGAAYAINPLPPKITSSPGPPMLMAPTVNNHVHNGSAATRGDLVHRPAAHTRAALTSPLINPLMGIGIEPI
ncbi:MAG: hypothetical protein QOH91_4492 [Mycobacterium sp.]|nr:hypothetical protein [Mycobacterium sp.]